VSDTENKVICMPKLENKILIADDAWDFVLQAIGMEKEEGREILAIKGDKIYYKENFIKDMDTLKELNDDM